MDHLISVIVPVYNGGRYLRNCIESILQQTHPHIQHILVDDGSTDGSGEICDELARRDSRITVIHQPNGGVSAARNAGLTRSTGDYLTFVDADDALVPHALETALNNLQSNNADMVTYGWKKIDAGKNRTDDVREEEAVLEDIPSVIRDILGHYSAWGGGYPWNKLWRRDVFDGAVPKFDPALYYFEDLEWVIRMLLRIRRVAVCPACLYHYYIRETSTTHAPEKAERRELGYHASIEKIIENLSGLPEIQDWFSRKYYPEIVNGVLFSVKNRFPLLRKDLLNKMEMAGRKILRAENISPSIKTRYVILHLLARMRLL